MNQASVLSPHAEEEWHYKLSSLQRQLLDAKIQQMNLRKINKNLEETMKNALGDQMNGFKFDPSQRLSMNMSWKQKYEIEAETNIQKQKYIKVLQKKRTTFSTDKKPTKNRNSFSAKLNLKSQDSNKKCHLIRMSNHQQPRQTLARNSSVKKMDFFMDRLIRQKHQISQFGTNYCANYQRQKQKRKKCIYVYEDPIQRMFCSVKQIENSPYDLQAGRQEWSCRKSVSSKQSTLPLRSKLQNEYERSISKKLQLNSHFR